jgi:pilus assembly protein Flp/PilA
MRQMLRRFMHDESAATMVEYGVMVALIAAVDILAVTTLGTEVRDTFQGVATTIGGV